MPRDTRGSSSKHKHPPSLINLEHFREPRSLKFVGVRDFEETSERNLDSLRRLMTYLNRASLVVSASLFVCQIGAAICLCRPVAVLGGVLVSLLFLCQGILGNYVVSLLSQVLLVGYSCMSAFVALVGMSSALYLLFDNFAKACVSSFHTEDDPSAITRLSVVKALSLVAAIPCLLGAISCFLSSTLAAKASTQSMKRSVEPQLFLYLQNDNLKDGESEADERSQERKTSCASPSAPGDKDVISNPRSGSPPPSYYQVNESFA